ncbi:MAG: hypothetical protein HQM08_18075 [Candidatus Riflebacteria bacterium]|nr:hypothetical protein [Candidatus Riflebacteria bacterium]
MIKELIKASITLKITVGIKNFIKAIAALNKTLNGSSAFELLMGDPPFFSNPLEYKFFANILQHASGG